VPPMVLAAAACVASLLISPYNYDYDLTILGVAIAFVLPRMIKMTSPAERVVLLGLCWFVTGYGLATGIVMDLDNERVEFGERSVTLSMIAPALLLLVGAAGFVLTRAKGFSAAAS